MAATITQGSNSLALVYDSEHDRIKQCVPNCTSPTAVTDYLNDPLTGTMSEKYVAGSTTTWRDHIRADGGIVGERFNTSGTVTWRYFVLDHLGSTSALTDGAGTVQERLSYDAWGKRRNADGSDNTTCSITSATTRGFTGHEEMDAQCLINANARVYDPSLGRFASADTETPGLFNGQAWNRFSYVNNGPLSYTDPTGHDDQHDSNIAPVVPDQGMLPEVIVTATRDPGPQYYMENGPPSGQGMNSGGGGPGNNGDNRGSPNPPKPPAPPPPPPPKPQPKPKPKPPACSASALGLARSVQFAGVGVTKMGVGTMIAGMGITLIGAAALQPEVVIAGLAIVDLGETGSGVGGATYLAGSAGVSYATGNPSTGLAAGAGYAAGQAVSGGLGGGAAGEIASDATGDAVESSLDSQSTSSGSCSG